MRSIPGCLVALILAPLTFSGCVVSTHGGVGAPLEVPPAPKPVSESSETGSETDTSTTPDAPKSTERISARHILVSYRGALRAAPNVVRSREEAFARAEEALSRARAGEPFDKLVEEYSDDMGSAARGGDLGEFGRQDMVAEFSEAAFKLQPGEISDVVESQFGFHVIQRTK